MKTKALVNVFFHQSHVGQPCRDRKKPIDLCHQALRTNLGLRSDPNLGTHPRLTLDHEGANLLLRCCDENKAAMLKNMPPRAVIAKKTVSVSKELLATTATLSPRRSPRARMALESNPTRSRNSFQVNCLTSLQPSRTSVHAVRWSSFL